MALRLLQKGNGSIFEKQEMSCVGPPLKQDRRSKQSCIGTVVYKLGENVVDDIPTWNRLLLACAESSMDDDVQFRSISNCCTLEQYIYSLEGGKVCVNCTLRSHQRSQDGLVPIEGAPHVAMA